VNTTHTNSIIFTHGISLAHMPSAVAAYKGRVI
jgi:hypothetical protein